MNLTRTFSAITAAALLTAPLTALAHEHRSFQIGDKEYSISIGSINEPVRVDDKSGVEIEVLDLSVSPPHEEMVMADGDEHAGTPVVGLESSLKVEVMAGDQKKMFDLRPVYGEPGGYKAVFIPTTQTTYTYRLVGTINDVPVDLTFPCNASGEVAAEETEPVQVSDQITQTHKSGSFGCPGAKEDVTFPESAPPVASLTARIQTLEAGSMFGFIGLGAGVLGLILGIIALIKVSSVRKTGL